MKCPTANRGEILNVSVLKRMKINIYMMRMNTYVSYTKYFLPILHKYPPTVCDKCNKLHHGACPVHGPLPELDHTVGYDKASLAFTELPPPAKLTMKISLIPGTGVGVFATMLICKGVDLG